MQNIRRLETHDAGPIGKAIRWALSFRKVERTFHLHRTEDESGISGTGIVAEGAVFNDGSAMLYWLTQYRSVAFYETVDDLEAIHGHNGKTQIIWRH